MKKTFILNEVDCPVCAGKLEEKINKINGVNNAKINFIMQQLVVEYDESQDAKLTKEVLKQIKKFDSDIEVEIA